MERVIVTGAKGGTVGSVDTCDLAVVGVRETVSLSSGSRLRFSAVILIKPV